MCVLQNPQLIKAWIKKERLFSLKKQIDLFRIPVANFKIFSGHKFLLEAKNCFFAKDNFKVADIL